MTDILRSPAADAYQAVPPQDTAPQLELIQNKPEDEVSRLRHGLQTVRHLGQAVVASVSNFTIGTMFTPEDIGWHAHQYKDTARLTTDHTKAVAHDWRSVSWRSGDKYKKPAIGSLAWANLVFGEAIAVGAQGAVQIGHGSNLASFTTAIVTATAVEVAFTTPIARSNRRKYPEPVTSHQVARGMGAAFWMGGAWGVDQEKLPPKYEALPIASYMVFGTALAVVGEHNNLAAKLIESPAFIGVLLVAGCIKKVNDLFGYKGVFESLGEKTADGAEKIFALGQRLVAHQSVAKPAAVPVTRHRRRA